MRTIRLATVLAIAASSPSALACAIATPGEFELAPPMIPSDAGAPSPPGAISVGDIGRGNGPVCVGDGQLLATSCDDMGTFSLNFPAAQDEGVEADEGTGIQAGVGYLVRVVSGELPDAMEIPETPTRAWLQDGVASIPFAWNDGATDAQEPFHVVLGVRAIDLAGNVSDEVTVEVSDPGYDGPEAAARCGGGNRRMGRPGRPTGRPVPGQGPIVR